MKSAKLSEKAYATFMFLAVSLLAGVLLSGVAVPFVAMASSGARFAVDSLDYLPAEFDTPAQSERSRILMADGNTLATFFDENRIYVGIDEISQQMQDAQVAIEDHRFYQHGAIDVEGIGRAFFRTISGDTQGASTLTQQYVKLVRVEAARNSGDEDAAREAVEVSLERKILEMRYAFAVEEQYSKDEILERYLNIAYYGNGAYGVESAARHYFGTTASELTLSQGALLAGIVQNPNGYDPVTETERALERRNLVLQRMADEDFITQDAADAAKQEGFDPEQVTRTPNGCTASQYPFLCNYVYETLVSGQVEGLGETEEERANFIRRGGLTIETQIDPKAQDAAEAAVANMVSPTDPVIGNSVLIQPSTGLIVAMAQSRPEMGDEPGQTYYNYNVDRSMNGAEGYQPGSTMKPFVAAAALNKGMPMTQRYNSPGQINVQGWTFRNCEGPFEFRQEYSPINLGRSGYGNINMEQATQNSVNTYYMQLLRDVGICDSIDLAQAAGVKLANGEDMRTYQDFPSWVLGTAEVTPLSMAEGYATFANRGTHCEPVILKSITTADGTDIPVPDGNCEQIMSPEAADGVNHLLQSVMDNGTGRPARIEDGRPQAGKTGTTNNNRAVWFAGHTPDVAGVAMIAIDPARDDAPSSLTGYRLANGQALRGTGGGDAGQIWRAAMGAALEGVDHTEFQEPPQEVFEGRRVQVPDVSGMNYEEAKSTLEAAGFNTRRWGVYSSQRAGTFLGISPSTEASVGATISLRVSVGPRPEPEPQQRQQPSQQPSDDSSSSEEDSGGGDDDGDSDISVNQPPGDDGGEDDGEGG